MVSNYEKEPIFVLEHTWDKTTKLPEKHKFQGAGSLKAEVYIDSGTFGMEFFLVKTLPQFNKSGHKLEFSWPLSLNAVHCKIHDAMDARHIPCAKQPLLAPV